MGTIIPFKDKFDNSLMLYADEQAGRGGEKRNLVSENGTIKEINETK